MMPFALTKFAPKLVATLLAVPTVQASALGLGPITLNSRLNDPLQAQIAVYGMGNEGLGANCLATRVTALDGNLISKPSAQLTGNGAGAIIKIAGRERLAEPVVNIVVEINCESTIRREYQLLLDPDQAIQPTSTGTGAVVPVASGTAHAGTPLRNRKTKPAPAARSVLTLSSTDTDLDLARPNLALRYEITLSEPRGESDKAKPASFDANQPRAAAPPASEAAAASASAQLRDAQHELRIAKQSAASLRQELEKAKAVMAIERQSLVPGSWLGLLAGLLVASVAIGLWLWRCRAEDKRRYQNELLILGSTLDTQAPTDRPAPSIAPAVSAAASNEPPPIQPAAMANSATLAAVPDEDARPSAPVVATPPQPAHAMLEWDFEPAVPHGAATAYPTADNAPPLLATEYRNREMRDGEPVLLGVAVPSLSEGPAQTHASEVASMLLEAESWMVEHNPLRAAKHLRPYLGREDMLSPAPGLYLMMLYQTIGAEEQIAALQAQMSWHFPDAAEYWKTDGRPRLTLNDFPEVLTVISTLSQTSALLPYLESLLLPPHKFDFSVYREIVRAIGAAAACNEPSKAPQFW